MLKNILAIAAAGLLAACATAGNDYDMATVDGLRPGMTQAQVISVMGEPNTRTRLADGSQQWIWTHAKANAFGSAKSKAVMLGFDRDGRYTGVLNSTQTQIR